MGRRKLTDEELELKRSLPTSDFVQCTRCSPPPEPIPRSRMAEHERTKKHEAASSEYAAEEARRTFQSQWNLSSRAQLLKYQIPVTYRLSKTRQPSLHSSRKWNV
ncbi:hypothetical protein D1P53_003215 [Cryptococcus gattii VGV]|nr:hypothetical protein D1P53_003215 [Cryptococcus gattii VGV]